MTSSVLFFLGLLAIFWGGIGVGWALRTPTMKEAARMMAKRKAAKARINKLFRFGIPAGFMKEDGGYRG